MSKRYLTVQEFGNITVAQSTLDVNLAGTSLTLGNSHSGDLIVLNATSGSVLALPSPVAGLNYHLVVRNTGPHTITAQSACIIGSVATALGSVGSLATGSAKTTISTTAGSAVGDSLSLTCDGTYYYLKGNVSNNNALKFD